MPSEPPPPSKSTFDESTFEGMPDIEAPPLGRQPWAAHWAGKIGRHHVALVTLTILALWAILTVPLWQGQQYIAGTIAEHDITAPHSTMLVEEDITASKRRQAAALVPPVYEGKRQAGQQALSELALLTDTLTTPLPDAKTLAQQWEQATAIPQQRLLPLAAQLLALPSANLSKVSQAAAQAVRVVYQKEQIRSDVPEDLHLVRRRILQVVEQGSLSAAAQHVASKLAMLVAKRPNLILNPALTERAKRQAEIDVQPVYQQFAAGDIVIRAGTVISSKDLEKLRALGIISTPPDVLAAGSKLILSIILVLLCAAFVTVVHASLLKEPTWLWLTAVIPLLFLVLFRILLRIPHGDWMLVPLAGVAAMVLAILFDARPGILAGFLVALCGAILANASPGLFFTAMLCAWVGALAMANITSRAQLMQSALLLTATQALLVVIFGYLQHLPQEQFPALLAWGVFSGIGAAFVAIAVAMLLERPFGITTHLRLLDLISPQEGVLLRMQTEAPGTYTHSMMVSMLSENAAKVVGADALLCRVAGLYHDIGKLRRPHCFIENQTGENIHDKLSPQLSAQIILSHVPDGLVLGKALRLPAPVLDIIAQHHGTSLVAYFYQRALCGVDVNTKEAVLESKFRYPGPPPQSKEAALVMLADTVEASSRALRGITPQILQGHVSEMISLRLRDGELSQCDLTLRDLRKIEESFVVVLRSALHHRIQYPEMESSMKRHSDQQWVQQALADGFNENHYHELNQTRLHQRQERKLNSNRRKNLDLSKHHEKTKPSSHDVS